MSGFLSVSPKTLRNFNLYIRSGTGAKAAECAEISYAGRVEEVTLPKLSINISEGKSSGRDKMAKGDQGLGDMEAEIVLLEYDTAVMLEFGLMFTKPGQTADAILRGAIVNNGGATEKVEVIMSGMWSELDMGTWQAGENAKLTLSMVVGDYTLKIADKPIYEFAAANLVRKIGDVDQYEDIKKCLEKP